MNLRVIQTLKQSPAHDADASFALPVWVGTIGGSALPTDPDPNTTPPSNARIVRCTPRAGSLAVQGPIFGGFLILAAPVAASSISVQLWYFEDTQNRWLPFFTGGSTTLTPTGAAANQAIATPGALLGAKGFLQITANTNVQALAYKWG